MSFDNIFESFVADAIAASESGNSLSELKKNILIDGESISAAENTWWRGLGMVSANNSSRLLLDCKALHPERYNELLNYIFGADGLAVSHLKIEMGADINSSSGTEPCIMRSEDEEPDVTRGAGFQLAADAKKINPELTLDMLWWSEPRWVTDSEDNMAARYRWYKANLKAAYDTYGLKFDYISANRNERTIDPSWIGHLAHALKSDVNTPYDFSRIKVVASDEEASWATAKKMLEDRSLLNAVDVVGTHYTSHCTDHVRTLIAEHNKEIWCSEGCPPMTYAKGARRFDGNGSGMSDIGGMLDVANRIITMFPEGGMTLYEFQPVVAAYYDGATFSNKQLIRAEEPWSGCYQLDSGFFMALHFSLFMHKGWRMVRSACAGDGQIGGDGHAIVDATYSYLTAVDPVSGDYSIVATNTTDRAITYNFDVKSLERSSQPLDVWETRGADSGSFDENYLRKIDTIVPEQSIEGYSFSVTLKPYSMVTVTTVRRDRPEFSVPEMTEEERRLALPYSDNFTYSEMRGDFLASRGGAPLFTTDQGGAFEVTADGGRRVLMQKITEATKADEWGYTPKPLTCFGDDRWYNYSVSCDVKLVSGSSDVYAGCGLRYNLAARGFSGWWLQLSADGSWYVNVNKRPVASGTVELKMWNTLRIAAAEDNITAWVNGAKVAEIHRDSFGFVAQAAGRAALYSSYHRNCFADIVVDRVVGFDAYVQRFDCTDENITYSGDWTYNLSDSFRNYRRTSAAGNDGASVEIKFSGTGLALLGENHEDAAIKVEIDGKCVSESDVVPRTESREVFWSISWLGDGDHVAKVTVESGRIVLDAVEVLCSEERRELEEPIEKVEKAAVPKLDLTPVSENEGFMNEIPVFTDGDVVFTQKISAHEEEETDYPADIPVYRDETTADDEAVYSYVEETLVEPAPVYDAPTIMADNDIPSIMPMKVESAAPAVEKTVPAEEEPVPAEEEPAPAEEEPVPAEEDPAPVVEEPVPVEEEPVPVEEEPVPAEEEPAPAEEEPVPVEEEPAPVEEKPAPVGEANTQTYALTVTQNVNSKGKRNLLPIIAAAGAGVAVIAGVIIAVAVRKKKK